MKPAQPCSCSTCPADAMSARCSPEHQAWNIVNEGLGGLDVAQALTRLPGSVWAMLLESPGGQPPGDVAEVDEVVRLAQGDQPSGGLAISGLHHYPWRSAVGRDEALRSNKPWRARHLPAPADASPHGGPELEDLCEVAPELCDAVEQVAETADGRRGGGLSHPEERLCFAPVVRPSPASGGRWLYRSLEVAAPSEFDIEAAHGPFPVRGLLCHPLSPRGRAQPAGPFPLVILLHGNHGKVWLTNRVEETAMECPDLGLTVDECVRAPSDDRTQPRGFKVLPLYRGYDFLQTALASHGIASLSLNLNGIDRPNSLYVGSVESRGRAALSALRWLRSVVEHRKGALPGGEVLPLLDCGRIGLFGHSRGGGAVLDLAEALARSNEFDITAVVAVEPAFLRPLTERNIQAGRFSLLMVTGSEDEDTFDARGAMFYDIRQPTPFKCHLFVRGGNHRSFNRHTEYGWHYESPRFGKTLSMLGAAQHEDILNAYTSAFLRLVLNHEQRQSQFLLGEAVPATVPADKVDLAFQVAERQIVDNFEDPHGATNILGESNRVSGKLREAVLSSARYIREGVAPWPYHDERAFGFGSNTSLFYGHTRGLVGGYGSWRTQLRSPIELNKHEIWVRCAVVPRTNYEEMDAPWDFWLGLEDLQGQQRWASSGQVGGARPAPVCLNRNMRRCTIVPGDARIDMDGFLTD